MYAYESPWAKEATLSFVYRYDLNRDDRVDTADIGAIASVWHNPDAVRMLDLDGSGKVDVADIQMVSNSVQ
ncbi:MAG: hypothetical protein A2Z04_00865 [Chloroflexi bacterium RBG_16_57_9]|nr:MAG: hypothetical protein A2Z04_00865 [Chloroflexi bacterium RBG_16_57_9]